MPAKKTGTQKAHAPGFLKLVRDAKQRIKEITVSRVMQKLKNKDVFRFVDVREDHEWESGHALGAEHIARGILERDVEHAIPDKTSEIVLYCGGGFRSALAADNLRKMGYRNAHSMAGGFRAWHAAHGPVVRSKTGK